MADPQFPFPILDRKVFANNPLVEVVCEVRFPTILRIESEIPSDFQERVRRRFPKFSRQTSPSMPELPVEVADALSGVIPKPELTFSDPDGQHGITLTSERLSVASQAYVSWDLFKSDVDLAIDSLVSVYEPIYFERIGLRYVNLIDRSKLGIQQEPWAELLNPMVAGELLQNGWADNIVGVRKSVQARFPDTGDLVQFQHGLGIIGDSKLSYILDFDYSCSDRTEISNVNGIIERLHGYSGSAFQWAITDKLQVALG